MAENAIACSSCSTPVPREMWNLDLGSPCPGCGRTVLALAFPALLQTNSGAAPEQVSIETEASCFYHPQNRAAIPCEECGRFLCNLCDLEVEGRHICPRCFESGVRSSKIQTVESRRPMWDSIALAVSTLPAMLFWPAIVTAPWSLFIVFRRWNAPSSVVPRTKIRFILAALFAIAEIGFIVFVIYMFMQVSLRGRRR